jgi:hypothetical protein
VCGTDFNASLIIVWLGEAWPLATDSNRRVCEALFMHGATMRRARFAEPRKTLLSLMAPEIGEPVIRRVQQLRQVKFSRHDQDYIKTVPSGRKAVAVPVARPGFLGHSGPRCVA